MANGSPELPEHIDIKITYDPQKHQEFWAMVSEFVVEDDLLDRLKDQPQISKFETEIDLGDCRDLALKSLTGS